MHNSYLLKQGRFCCITAFLHVTSVIYNIVGVSFLIDPHLCKRCVIVIKRDHFWYRYTTSFQRIDSLHRIRYKSKSYASHRRITNMLNHIKYIFREAINYITNWSHGVLINVVIDFLSFVSLEMAPSVVHCLIFICTHRKRNAAVFSGT